MYFSDIHGWKPNLSMKIAIIVLIILIIIWVIRSLVRTGYLPSEFFQEHYEKLKNTMIIPKDPEPFYEKVIGHEVDQNVNIAMKSALKKEKKEKTAINALILADLNNFHYKQKNEARHHYQNALNRLPETNNEDTFQVWDRLEDVNVQMGIINSLDEKKKNNHLKKTPDYFKVKPRNDPQNTHDHVLTNSLKQKYDRIKKLNGDFKNTDLQDLEEKIKNNEKAKKAYETINKNINIQLLNERELDVLKHVWTRAKQQNAEDLVVSALQECVENNITVCAMGRVSRIIESLVVVDSDPEISSSGKTTSILRSEIMSKAFNILEKEKEKLKAENPKLYDEYTNSLDDESKSEDLQKWETHVRQEFNKIAQDYPNIAKAHSIIKEAHMGI